MDKEIIDKEFYEITKYLINHPTVLQMKNYRQHYDTNCYDHCIEVAYWSYKFCKKHNLDYVSMARASILHDLFLYDWRHSKARLKGWHAFIHPKIALENALKICDLNEKEKDIILKHMWPVTMALPKYKESYILTLVDKYCALNESYQEIFNRFCQKKFFRYAYVFLCFLFIKL